MTSLIIDEHNGTFIATSDMKVTVKSTFQDSNQDIKCIKCNKQLPLISVPSLDILRELEQYQWMHSECYKLLNSNDINELRDSTH
jgi:hypothetical protein